MKAQQSLYGKLVVMGFSCIAPAKSGKRHFASSASDFSLKHCRGTRRRPLEQLETVNGCMTPSFRFPTSLSPPAAYGVRCYAGGNRVSPQRASRGDEFLDHVLALDPKAGDFYKKFPDGMLL